MIPRIGQEIERTMKLFPRLSFITRDRGISGRNDRTCELVDIEHACVTHRARQQLDKEMGVAQCKKIRDALIGNNTSIDGRGLERRRNRSLARRECLDRRRVARCGRPQSVAPIQRHSLAARWWDKH